MELLSYLAFNSTSILVEASDAYLFREVSANGATLLLDELENLRDEDKDTRSSTMAILNSGFKRGGSVPRMEKIGDRYKTTDHISYSPKAFAGLNQVTDTLGDRSFKISMFRKKRSEQVGRFRLADWESKLERMRDDLYLFGLNEAIRISALYEHSDLSIPEELDDRLRDIFEPLFAVASLIDTQMNDGSFTVSNSIRLFALSQAGVRISQELDDDSIAQIVQLLIERMGEDSGPLFLRPADLLEMFKLSPDLAWITSKKKAGEMMRKLGLRSETHRIPGQSSPPRGYLLTRERLEDLRERFISPISPNRVSQVSQTDVSDEEAEKPSSVTEERVTEQMEAPF